MYTYMCNKSDCFSDVYVGLNGIIVFLYDTLRCRIFDCMEDVNTYIHKQQINKTVDLKSPIYCDIKDVIDKYNEFMLAYQNALNDINHNYIIILRKLSGKSTANMVIKRWMDDLKNKLKYVQFIEFKYKPLILKKTQFILCQDVFDILQMLKDDIDNKMRILKNLTDNRPYRSPEEIYNAI